MCPRPAIILKPYLCITIMFWLIPILRYLDVIFSNTFYIFKICKQYYTWSNNLKLGIALTNFTQTILLIAMEMALPMFILWFLFNIFCLLCKSPTTTIRLLRNRLQVYVQDIFWWFHDVTKQNGHASLRFFTQRHWEQL